MNKKTLWKSALDLIQIKLNSPADFKAWFTNLELISLENGVIQIGCKSTFAADWLEKKYKDLIITSIEKTYEEKINRLTFTVINSNKTANSVKDDLSGPLFEKILEIQNQEKRTEENVFNAGLNKKYTFDNFIVGSSNRLAHAAALAAADNPGTTYNPLYIYGGVGLGKTHLMQAIGIQVLKKNPKALIHYCSCESFLNELVDSIRSGKTNAFRSKYRALDVLIIDDIQFISNKIETQNELFHTFNELHQANKQIILASDRPPTEIQNLEDRLRSRFQGGMVADVNQPDYEMRIAILQKKAEERNFQLPPSTIDCIAKLVDSNIRELEGSLLKVVAFAGISNGNLTESEIAKILGKDATTKRTKVKSRDIIDAVCGNFEINLRDIRGKKRTKEIALARQIAMYLLRTELDLQLAKVSQELNRSDHTTAINAVEKIEDLLKNDEDIRNRMQSIKKQLGL